MNYKLKNFIFDKLFDDLKNLDIIEDKKTNTIWVIDREKKYWYLIYEKTQRILHWRWNFFTNFFHLFSMEENEFQPLVSEWVEEVLNCKVNSLVPMVIPLTSEVGKVLNKPFWYIFRKPTDEISLRS